MDRIERYLIETVRFAQDVRILALDIVYFALMACILAVIFAIYSQGQNDGRK